MVTFNNASYTIEISTGGNPIEDWLEMHSELCDLLQSVDTSLTVDKNYIRVLELLREMMPDWDTAKKLTK